MFKKIFSLEINKQQVAVGFGNPGNKNDAIYDPVKQRVVLRSTLLEDVDKLKRILRHEIVHVVITQVEEMLAERIEEAVDRIDAAFTTFVNEHPERLR